MLSTEQDVELAINVISFEGNKNVNEDSFGGNQNIVYWIST